MAARQRRSSRATGSETNTAAHKKLRKTWLARLAMNPGMPCVRCGQPMWPGMPVELDHSDDRTFYLGLSHKACNRRDGQAKTTAILKAKGRPLTPRQLLAIRMKARQQASATVTTSANRGQPPYGRQPSTGRTPSGERQPPMPRRSSGRW
jgi:hypothetical protein